MKTEKTSIKQALKVFNISRTTLYNYLKDLEIKPIKEGNRVHLLDTQIHDIKAFIEKKNSFVNIADEQLEQHGQPNTSENIYIKQIKELKKELITEQEKTNTEREENKKLLVQIGQWQGRAKTLEEQNQKLLALQAPIEEESIDAEIITPEPSTEEVIETKKTGFFARLFRKI